VRYIGAVTLEPPRLHPEAPAGAAAARLDGEGPWLDLAMRAAGMSAIAWNIPDDTVYFSARVADTLGGEAGVVAAEGGERLFRNVFADDLPRVRGTVLGAVATGEPYQIEHRAIRPGDGAVIWLLSAGTPVRDASGKVVRLLGVVQEITDRKAAEGQRETLVAELDHRIKNILASVQSMAFQSARKAPSLDAFLKTFAGRLKAMSSAHTLLTTTRWRGAGVQHIVAAELSGQSQGQTRWEGPEITLTPRATNALALALHELAANAVKFGALSTDAGRVDVNWRLKGDGGLALVWTESGGPLVSPPTRQGFGSTLLEKVTGRELGGEVRVEFLATGVRAILTSDATVIIPPQDEPAATEAAPDATIAGASTGDIARAHAKKVVGLKVLIVEDSLLLSLELENGLTEAGAVVVGQAADVAEALAMLKTPIDVAVLDANLNGESVAPVAEALTGMGVPFIFATGYGDNQAAPQGFDAPFIRKPYDVTQVAAALAEVTGRT